MKASSFNVNKKTKVIKTGPDRPVEPVEPGTGHESGSASAQNRSANKPEENRINRC
jgi:hypothetical protein